MEEITLHYVGDPLGELALKLSLNEKQWKGPISKLTGALHKRFLAKHPSWLVAKEQLWLETVDGTRLKVACAVSEALEACGRPTSLVVRSKTESSKWADLQCKSACEAFRSLEFVDGECSGTIPGVRASRTWFLGKGVLSRDGAAWAVREADDLIGQVPKSTEAKTASRLAECLRSYKLGFALNRERKFRDAAAALAKSAALAAYTDGGLDPQWPRKIFREWGNAVACLEADRWNEVAVHKLGVSRGVWRKWDCRPSDELLDDDSSNPVLLSCVAKLEAARSLLLEEFTRVVKAEDPRWRRRDSDDDWRGGDMELYIDDLDAKLFPVATGLLEGARIYFTKLPPRAHVATRCAPTNKSLRCELSLQSTRARTKLRVGHAVTDAPEDRALVYDPSVEHELWHDGTLPRVAFVCELPRAQPLCSN